VVLPGSNDPYYILNFEKREEILSIIVDSSESMEYTFTGIIMHRGIRKAENGKSTVVLPCRASQKEPRSASAG
jgi:hypothetical protein